MEAVAVLLFLAVVLETLMERLKERLSLPGWLIPWLVYAAGFAAAWGVSEIRLLAVAGVSGVEPAFDFVVTGLAIGGGSSVIHELIRRE